MAKKLFTITDLGPGDGGKGGVVHKVSSLMGAHTIIKIGGAQGSHGVKTHSGKSFNFSQFGCGTFEGVKTHISELMVIDPFLFWYENNMLEKAGLSNPSSLVSVSEKALCNTPYHMAASRLREIARRDKQKGTVGTGCGEAKESEEKFPELAIYAKDLNSPVLSKKLDCTREQKLSELSDVVYELRHAEWLTHEDSSNVEFLVSVLENSPSYLNRKNIESVFNDMGSMIKVVDDEFVKRELFKRDGNIVVESSHGVLTDCKYGFRPNVSRLRTIPKRTLDWLNDLGYDGDIVKLAVSRAYGIRHGAGPMVTETPDWDEKILSGSHKGANRWQGSFRVGPLDLVALRYAIEACGGQSFFDGLVFTWFDQIVNLGDWTICDSYKNATNQELFRDSCHINFRTDTTDERQERLTSVLYECRPNLQTIQANGLDKAGLISVASEIAKAKLGLKLKMVSFGPTEVDKICL